MSTVSNEDEQAQRTNAIRAAIDALRRDLQATGYRSSDEAGAALRAVASLRVGNVKGTITASATIEAVATLTGGTEVFNPQIITRHATDTLTLNDFASATVTPATKPPQQVDWPNALLLAVLVVYMICGTEATSLWPGIKEPVESVEQRLGLVLAVYALYEAKRR